jgi:hypothetical protein
MRPAGPEWIGAVAPRIRLAWWIDRLYAFSVSWGGTVKFARLVGRNWP